MWQQRYILSMHLNVVCISLIILCDDLQEGLWVLSQIACFKFVGYVPRLIFLLKVGFF